MHHGQVIHGGGSMMTLCCGGWVHCVHMNRLDGMQSGACKQSSGKGEHKGVTANGQRSIDALGEWVKGRE